MVGLFAVTSLVLMVAFLASIAGPRIFGDDPGGRDPSGPNPPGWSVGQFGWFAPRYIEFLREKRRLIRKQRKKY